MGRLSARSNPTGLIEIDRWRISITVLEIGGRRSFALEKLDLAGLNLAGELNVFVVARAGSSSTRYDLGPVEMYSREHKSIDDLDASQLLRFRVLIRDKSIARFAATAENLRPRNDAESESLLPMEPADLGERLWKLVLGEDGPVLLFNSRVFPSAAGAENYLPFGAMVLPEALRQVMARIASEPDCLDDESSSWHQWSDWINVMGGGPPPIEGDDAAIEDWCERVVDSFCERFGFASRLNEELLRETGND